MTPKLSEADYEFIRELVYRRSRINLGGQKHELVAGRVAKRLRHLAMSDYAEYCDFLQSQAGAGELTDLIDAISTNHTSFFRDERHFEILRTEILGKLGPTSTLGGARKFRVWSAACSSGEEPYSIAISLAEHFQATPGASWDVDATDISRRMLATAEAGIYPAERVTLPNPEWMRRYFQRGVDSYEGFLRVKREVRNRVRFHHVNLFQETYPFAAGFQVVFCRNVMIYFDRATQQQLIERISQQSTPAGFLILGPSESLIGIKHPYRYVCPGVYQRAT